MRWKPGPAPVAPPALKDDKAHDSVAAILHDPAAAIRSPAIALAAVAVQVSHALSEGRIEISLERSMAIRPEAGDHGAKSQYDCHGHW
mmetsp:Transcript_14900/g.38454  ORF Transcript_14900/g.38454 Transcript_14900/m.38454 type:complete len:88 (-) Transcript_14900:209-472(-)|eukprot:CAMPEP_0115856394 /NCGR_PEP_ID=MMETSP0287-20121206/15030_1 /TAXON_ID=412157 /ORGANISM="Chrysochromulina rotalis, Strain UIO044" /LENGTH=87 /DNA_ID=CAMNT_0003310567 /DNA_START=520 /DNA_END=783 /DNA_ORIENTATION=-